MRTMIYASFAMSLLLVGCNSATDTPTEEVKPPAETPIEETPEDTTTLPERESTMDVVLSVEGQDSTITMDLVEGSDAMYSLYIDPQRYTFETSEKEDKLMPINEVPEGYPEVNMTFLYVENQTPESVKEDMEQEYSMPLEEKSITAPINALSLHGTSGEESDSEVVTIYMMEVDGGTLLIKENYFLEAQEGHGARFEQMLETLEVRK
ncbi:hypothetical protein CSV80_06220 [Sporosarcina sp. P12(2017)]|uniref:hypothetical protein n=1 Tax=unclassified Sporosarcina TaxID=2647733 RepID=UPI000C1697A2|nr:MULTISPECIES: hypothetical protein [unclassified Sporosarcina]PIC57903.1 hypothetical protein CSV81_06365 [Sporosarcina sp. P10]PIC61285.1 hypothetical protein CSV80_06220 [Sporosarcina sp. P12(2017)]